MTAQKQASLKQRAGGVVETAKTLAYAALIAVTLHTVAFRPFNIPSGSMIPTLLVDDFLFVSKYSYGYSRYSLPFRPNLFGWTQYGRIFARLPHRGDVVVFRGPLDTSVDFIKRVIGLPGDHIQVRQGQLYINGTLVPRTEAGTFLAGDEAGNSVLTKRYIEALPQGKLHAVLKYNDEPRFDVGSEVDANNTPDYVVPDGDLFMMGDNRDNSADSRFQNSMGFVPLANVIGRAQFIYFSIEAVHPLWQFWYWPTEVRWSRLLKGVG